MDNEFGCMSTMINENKIDMKFDMQPTLQNNQVILSPLLEDDFEALYAVASDPEIWKQHPNKDRWKREVFQTFFEGAMQSGGAFKIIDSESGEVIGSTRIYDYNDLDNSIFVGYTFYGVSYWGKGVNKGTKILMLNYLFQFVSKVILHVGSGNLRSQIAVARLGAEKTGEVEVGYYGEIPKINYVYEITKINWTKSKIQSI